MANDSTSGGSNNGLLYGIIGALGVIVVGGGFYLFNMNKPSAPPVQATIPAPPAPPAPAAAPAAPPPPAAVARPAPPPPAPAGPTAAQINQARNLIADARRFASTGDFANAEVALQNADKASPGFAEIAQARREIAEMRTAHGQLGPLIERVRHATERGDYATAERTLAEAERIDANAPAVIDARRELRAAERQANRPQDPTRPQDTRVTFLVTAARAAILVGDLASADRALGQAEQIDPRDAAVVQARAEFYAAQRSGRPARN